MQQNIVHWCAKIKGEVKKLVHQWNEVSERTERPSWRLTWVRYGSTCADMQLDVIGECRNGLDDIGSMSSEILEKRLQGIYQFKRNGLSGSV